MTSRVIVPTPLLLPAAVPLDRWSVVACDQFTSQPSYWEEVAALTQGWPSTFSMILPECWLESPDAPQRRQAIWRAMAEALEGGVFRQTPPGLIYLERTLETGRVRRGLVGALDLEAYSPFPQPGALVQATEGTVAERLPPRMAVRRGAPLELPHILVLFDDPQERVLGPLKGETGAMTPAYAGSLMLGGGQVAGWQLNPAQVQGVLGALGELEAASPAMAYAVGDGNHSLAAAKACFQEQKARLPQGKWQRHPARYALVELVNLYDPGLTFRPIHRLVTGVDPQAGAADLAGQLGLPLEETPFPGGQPLGVVTAQGKRTLWAAAPGAVPVVAAVQQWLDGWLPHHPAARLDYIHGEQDLEALAAAPGALGLELPAVAREELFPQVRANGPLPRKSFSLGEAREKRYYLEARRIL